MPQSRPMSVRRGGCVPVSVAHAAAVAVAVRPLHPPPPPPPPPTITPTATSMSTTKVLANMHEDGSQLLPDKTEVAQIGAVDAAATGANDCNASSNAIDGEPGTGGRETHRNSVPNTNHVGGGAKISTEPSRGDEDGPTQLRPPDGGWGWAVVAAAFFINMASDGISFSFGLLYIEFLRYFGQSRSTTSWVGSLFMAVPMLTGPIASAMVDRYGCRAMTILGGVVSGVGFVVSAWAETIGQMYLTFGILAGLGLGLCFITAVVSIAYWFERRRTLAMSLGAAGTGFGTFIYAPVTNYFISEFGWRGTVLILAGTFFNLCVCGVVMRDPAWWTAEQKRVRKAVAEGEHLPLKTCPLVVTTPSPVNTHRPSAHSISISITPSPSPLPSPQVSTNNLSAPQAGDGSSQTTPLLPQRSRLAPPGAATSGSATSLTPPSQTSPSMRLPPVVLLRAESMPCFRRRVSLLSCPAGSLPQLTVPAPIGLNNSSYRSAGGILALLRAVADFSLFLEWHFLLMSVGTTLLYTWFFVPYFYLADYLTRSGLYSEADASRLLCIVGVTNTIGMVALGWVGDHPRIHATKTYALCLLVCGLAAAVMPLVLLRHWLLAAACAAFGASFASTFSFTPTILAELVPMERFTVAYGLNLLCQGVGNLVGPPFAGWLFDVTESWDLSFYMAGLNICIAGGLTALIPFTKNRRFFKKV